MKQVLTIFIVFSSILPLLSCNANLKEREEQLKEREAALLERENDFALKEADYASLIALRDSISSTNTVQIDSLPGFDLAGRWNNHSVCIASTCNDIVIGDQKSEIVEIVSDSNGLIAKVFDKGTVLRVYRGSVYNNEIHLNYRTGTVNMKITLNNFSRNRIKGIRELERTAGCRAVHSVNLERLKS